MKFIDIHAHLESKQFEKDINEVISRAKEKEVLVINSGSSHKSNIKTLELSKKYPETIKASIGLYPTSNLSKDIESELKFIEENKGNIIAISEIGLDYSYDKVNKEKQKEVFIKQIELARKLNKPIIVHSRKAEKDVIDILENYKDLKIILHCFCGRKSLIKKGVKLGFYFSVPPVIKRWENFKGLVEIVPLEKILTETDSPYLSYEPHKRNEPINVEITIKEISKIKKLNKEKVQENILENFKEVFWSSFKNI